MPQHPSPGDCYLDKITGIGYTWKGNAWVQLDQTSCKILPKDLSPTKEQLKNHPALKQAWDEYLVIRKLIGL